MNSKKQTKFNGELHFGISNLNNSSLINHFFPEDLPEDWRYSYYSNEFDLLLIHLSDLNLPYSLTQSGNNYSVDKIIEQLTALVDDTEGSAYCVFDCSGLSLSLQQQLYESQVIAEANCYFINLDKLSETTVISHSTQLEWGCVFAGNDLEETFNSDLFCHVKSETKIAPAELRRVIENIRDYALAKNGRTMNIVFSSNYALENCRNAILLESMM
ncbi:MAG: hypothetical protein KZQ64_12170 [gamma proteobacterium symbiont of Bathyaustriella thionipta]|nr:hypothetical protein [gamma proteobacterium symbiont of Bathyaustriella thionipta]MCU7948428.1 hypothetical protein [gamma proteobacterium symbiont of Bathyaustriella thionipta]MCU7954127.1 hypothetical protein [gamma proteobacterium symbiont of Bathyaustriella thionipta]MCU7955978.1 hypothetical protein [gamma proteobacterium symbiont of Bathyaustriella thionipta]MCU7968149.1 hypothetical protein [gamma proteobacterium symbiont of Bathyaustriella thionipta]